MKKDKASGRSQKPSENRSYSLDERESEAAAEGAPTRGFDYESPELPEDRKSAYEEFASGATDREADQRAGRPDYPDINRASDTLVDDDANSYYDDSTPDLLTDRTAQGGGDVYAGDPDIMNFGPQDLRYGGEDVSGVSEWTMRAHHPELEDGLDAGDFKRSDQQILRDVREILREEVTEEADIALDVKGAEVTLSGQVETVQVREKVENLVLSIPGVREVYNKLDTKLS